MQALMPAGDLPAYPSEDAVVSGVAAEMLKLLFPASVEEITRRAGEQREAALLSGKAAASDVAAGLALGKAIAPIFAARAAADGMRTAGGTPAQTQALADAAAREGRDALAEPRVARRGRRCCRKFGKVRAWMMTPTDVVNERPARRRRPPRPRCSRSSPR